MPTDRPDDTPPRVARRATRPAMNGNNSSVRHPSRRSRQWHPLMIPGIVAGLVMVFALFGAGLWLADSVRSKRQATERSQTDEPTPSRPAGDPQTAVASKSTLTVRELDETALTALEKAREANPIVAREQLGQVRYRIRSVRIGDFDNDGLVSVGCDAIRYGFTVRFRDNILRQLKRGEVIDIEATCTTFELYGHSWHIAFEDAVRLKSP